jgi:hypothetical protein
MKTFGEIKKGDALYEVLITNTIYEHSVEIKKVEVKDIRPCKTNIIDLYFEEFGWMYAKKNLYKAYNSDTRIITTSLDEAKKTREDFLNSTIDFLKNELTKWENELNKTNYLKSID